MVVLRAVQKVGLLVCHWVECWEHNKVDALDQKMVVLMAILLVARSVALLVTQLVVVMENHWVALTVDGLATLLAVQMAGSSVAYLGHLLAERLVCRLVDS